MCFLGVDSCVFIGETAVRLLVVGRTAVCLLGGNKCVFIVGKQLCVY